MKLHAYITKCARARVYVYTSRLTWFPVIFAPTGQDEFFFFTVNGITFRDHATNLQLDRDYTFSCSRKYLNILGTYHVSYIKHFEILLTL